MALFKPRSYPLLEIVFVNGKTISMRGDVEISFFWATIENGKECLLINREQLIMIREKEGG